MIEFLQGEIAHIRAEGLTVDVQGVGYLVLCPNPYSFQKHVGEQMKVFTYQHVREDAIQLYGFPTREERSLFEKLINVSGIGPKGALAILAAGHPDAVIEAIEQENETFLVKFPGVGKKTARQMILDLKGKVEPLFPHSSLIEDQVSEEISATEEDKALAEAHEALKALGYAEKEIKKITPELQKESLDADEYVKKALRLMLNM
ncbi:Holliday junction branch migration protein RuvA [Salsuginibacillus kocurii]|uniref:Holliday junction branch migration protein RuvA n=1 Tax=Salsuginibacillus kocurii TaxID=427078 RepID=UPI0003769C22|nr:Holliday junction branch migration protein RuvA [Salsuginibacillus kocurii]